MKMNRDRHVRYLTLKPTVDQLVRHARVLAARHQVVTRKGPNGLLALLDENENVLRTFNRSTLKLDPERRLTPAAVWLLDNFYLIEEQIQMARRHFPQKYSQELPRLVDGPLAGLPRVYEIVLDLIVQLDSQVDAETLSAFIAAYQSVTPLKLGELWAIPIMLRLGLIDNLQRITSALTRDRQERNLADGWVDRLQTVAEKNPSHLVVVVAEMAQSEIPVSPAFVAEFCQRLALHSPVLHLARSWVEQRLGEHGSSIEQLVHQDSQQQAADQVSVSQSIASLRFLSTMDWKEFVETLSLVEETLRTDPADVYRKMDFSTRDRYRHAVETFSRQSALTETDVARQAIALAADSARQKGPHDRTAHVGFYLIDKGESQLSRNIKARKPLRTILDRSIRRLPLSFYGGGIALLTALTTYGFMRQLQQVDVRGGILVTFTILFFFAASQLAVALINWVSTLVMKPLRLPRLDYSDGIMSEDRTIVVVPTMLTSANEIDHLVETLEIHYLANRDPHIRFALLTDYRDAAEETLPGDEALLAHARAGIEALNKQYAPERKDLFFLLHRPRRWNEGEGLWMGYERKRGKLMEFNALLRGKGEGAFCEIVGATSILSSIKYVITLDADTQLPRDAARQLIGTMAHVLNRPLFDPDTGIIKEGYGILQPRVGTSLPSSRRSWFVRIFASDAGIDPYTRQVSDVYQDIFREGSFIGKGIYDVDAFKRAMQGRFPENRVLSHDLIEACHARSALVSDVVLYEEYPSLYNVDVNRRHRWIRGDWQITQWLLPRVPGPDDLRVANPLSALSRWKIFDNVRRSLYPVASTFLLLGTWVLRPDLGAFVTLLLLFMVALPGLLSRLFETLHRRDDVPWGMHLRGVAGALARQFGQVGLTLAFLPYDAYMSLDAIGRTLARLLFTHKRLLEWQTSRDSERTARTDPTGFFIEMWIAPFTALALGLFLAGLHMESLYTASPLLVLWLLAPGIAWWISRPLESATPDLTPDQWAFLRRAARKTWHYFETFVTEQENWLPPDNVQVDPFPAIASRTSPTNMGMALLSNMAAYDFGYLSVGGLIQRTKNTLNTMQKLKRYRGHFYNWYDTRTMQPLLPLYVSSVDSGNLAGHLLTLGAGLRELPDAMIYTPQIFSGLRDTLDTARSFDPDHSDLAALKTDLLHPPSGLRAAYALLMQMADRVKTMAAAEGSDTGDERSLWIRALQHDCEGHAQDLLFLAPWLALSEQSLTGPAAELVALLDQPIPLQEMAELHTTLAPQIETLKTNGIPLDELLQALREGEDHARQRLIQLEKLADQSDRMAAMDFTFLYDRARDLFTVGFNVAERRKDKSFYDLLASEARLCSYVAIALGQIPQDHWFSLSRLLVAPKNEPMLISWSGSMFEYLMPMLVMPTYENTLLDRTCRSAVLHQREYGALRGVPWGISESGYNQTDAQLNYQYRAFGVPGQGLKRGLAEDLVIAPYASALALMVAPLKACENLQRLANEKREGAYGFFEAVDYTPSRLPPGEKSVTIRSFMAHHLGMSLLSMDNLIHRDPMPRRFLACPMLKAAELLLQERMPRTSASVFIKDLDMEMSERLSGENEGTMRVYTNPSSSAPGVHLLSNGRYHVAISSAGGGKSQWNDLAVTRWREDATRDHCGIFIYLRDPATGEFWSAAHQPTRHTAKGYEAIFTQGRAEFRQQHGGLEVHTEISVSPEDDVELRRVTISNRTSTARTLELTSYAEVVLAVQAADAAHPAFSNLFVQTEFLRPSSAVLCTRRARSRDEKPPWLMHLMVGDGHGLGEISCETDRARFVGRGGTSARPAAMKRNATLSNTVGPVLDPIISLRRTVSLPPYGSATVNLVWGMAHNREEALALTHKYQSSRMSDRVFDMAWTHSQVILHQINATEAEAQLYGRLASALIYADPARRASASVLQSNRRGQNSLWGHSISGDLPIVLLQICSREHLELVRQLIQAHAYWRMKGLKVDLVILYDEDSIYRKSLQDQIISLISSSLEAQLIDNPGGIFVKRLDQVSHDDRTLLQAAARIDLEDYKGTLAEQVEHRRILETRIPDLTPTRTTPKPSLPEPLPKRDLLFHNGLGGFTPDGREYVITLNPGQDTPAPWVNVLANPMFGTVISESGASYSWFENAHGFRLTPWDNDPVRDTAGEALYIRDEETGEYWSPTPSPARGATPYVIRHGFGYTIFEHLEHGIESELWVYVAMDAAIKFSVLKLRNVSGRPRRLSVTGYWEWVLDESRQKSLLHVQTKVDLKTGALLARNYYNTEFPGRIAFVDVNDSTRTVTGDRKEFIGRNGDLSQPAALKRTRLSGNVGSGLDPCGAMQVMVDLPDGQEREIEFRLGMGRNMTDAQHLIQRFRGGDASRVALTEIWEYWNRTLGTVNVVSPDPTVNIMANGWLLYQTLSSRMWGRSGFYQSGGAYGFRDQLQDVGALVYAEPGLAREHLLRAASRQFKEGDVQHWWHPPAGRGVRTHISDDYLWLPFITCRYVAAVADTGVLDEIVPFLEARPLRQDEDADYDLPNQSDESASLYQHCVRAIEHGLRFGERGLPLMGGGDWNDGMNQVGHEGRGESVWLGFFLYSVLSQFSKLARAQDDPLFADRCDTEARRLQENLEQHTWDGEWYQRAFFDNGDVLGSHTSPECQIDAIPQSWSILSGAGDPERSKRAMQKVNERLVDRKAGLIKLFDPAFDKSALNPGYIKGYIPGVRENGGQYSHAAIWTIMAFARMGDHETAWELFNLVNPINHGSTAEQIATYKVEPYVLAADVYAVPPHTGRGGWTWYTGSAAWMYRLLVETLLGLDVEGNQLKIQPLLPESWSDFKMHYRYQQTVYHIAVSRLPEDAGGARQLTLDGTALSSDIVPLVNDQQEHYIELKL